MADLGGTLIAYMAWKKATEAQRLMPVDGFTPDQRFFIGFAQWACENTREANSRMQATVDPSLSRLCPDQWDRHKSAGVRHRFRVQGRPAYGEGEGL